MISVYSLLKSGGGHAVSLRLIIDGITYVNATTNMTSFTYASNTNFIDINDDINDATITFALKGASTSTASIPSYNVYGAYLVKLS